MGVADFRGGAGDLEQFSRVLHGTVAIEQLNDFEHRMRWEGGGTSGSSSAVALRSGLRLNATKLSWDRPWSFQFRDTATPLKIMLGRGEAPRLTSSNGPRDSLSAGMLQVRKSGRATVTTCEFVQGGAQFEQLALEVDPVRLRELVGGPALPAPLEAVLAASGPLQMHEQPMAPALSRLLDEILHAGARGASRQIHLEAKGLELLAVVLDELTLLAEASSPFGPRDLERLERARRILLERIECPPSLAQLARSVGLNEFKLKQGFREVFGASVFGCLRAERMDVARRLLVRRHLSVSEVALRVGYTNPSKFASAFRKHFGVPPSAVRSSPRR